MRAILIVLSGLLLLVVGLVTVLVAILGIIDPEGAQFANDADPFGQPPPIGWDIALLLLGALAGGGGSLLIWHEIRPRGAA